MAQPIIAINPYPQDSFPIYDFHTNTKIGDVLPKELFVWAGYSMVSKATGKSEDVYWAYTAKKGWWKCRIPHMWGEWIWSPAYDRDSAYSDYVGYYDPVNKKTVYGYKFLVRRKCRIWTANLREVTSIYAGDWIVTDGKSNGGSSRPYLLSIRGYSKGGTFRSIDNGWCDTDIEIGYSGGKSVTVYGKW
ncbi:hypothetical protein [Caldibacillus debilis]|uniref:hypothetical protein n=1 Tax=Caldibacillus debilis TaxID=301148 RepID=UPI0023F2A972|nr:hypothetical protein [Caldibacillus debilis]